MSKIVLWYPQYIRAPNEHHSATDKEGKTPSGEKRENTCVKQSVRVQRFSGRYAATAHTGPRLRADHLKQIWHSAIKQGTNSTKSTYFHQTKYKNIGVAGRLQARTIDTIHKHLESEASHEVPPLPSATPKSFWLRQYFNDQVLATLFDPLQSLVTTTLVDNLLPPPVPNKRSGPWNISLESPRSDSSHDTPTERFPLVSGGELKDHYYYGDGNSSVSVVPPGGTDPQAQAEGILPNLKRFVRHDFPAAITDYLNCLLRSARYQLHQLSGPRSSSSQPWSCTSANRRPSAPESATASCSPFPRLGRRRTFSGTRLRAYQPSNVTCVVQCCS